MSARPVEFLNPQILFDGGLVLDYVKKVKTFLDANPYEVFTFIFTNPDRASIPDVWKPIFDEAGITPMAYVPPSRPMKRNDWPTLRNLIDANKRVIIFLDAGADGSAGGTVDFILPQFQMVRLCVVFFGVAHTIVGLGRPLLPHRLELPLQDRQGRGPPEQR
jgi:hypothetical protein